MTEYDTIRQRYRPAVIKMLMIAESPPPDAATPSSRHFYRTDTVRKDDRLFTNTIRALYPQATELSEAQLQQQKDHWLRQFQSDGWYMVEALPESLAHEVTKPQRQALIAERLPELIKQVSKLATKDTKIILIKSNVFVVAAEPLRQAGFTVLNQELLDYPGRFNQADYRRKLASLVD